jgi:hypothetical protein
MSKVNSCRPKQFGASELELAAGDLFFHEALKTIHKLRPAPEVAPTDAGPGDVPVKRLRCGRVVRKGFLQLRSVSFEWPKCKICFA